jgi:hypothetical protein
LCTTRFTASLFDLVGPDNENIALKHVALRKPHEDLAKHIKKMLITVAMRAKRYCKTAVDYPRTFVKDWAIPMTAHASASVPGCMFNQCNEDINLVEIEVLKDSRKWRSDKNASSA